MSSSHMEPPPEPEIPGSEGDQKSKSGPTADRADSARSTTANTPSQWLGGTSQDQSWDGAATGSNAEADGGKRKGEI